MLSVGRTQSTSGNDLVGLEGCNVDEWHWKGVGQWGAEEERSPQVTGVGGFPEL